jgi:hypothetical protein
MVSNQLSAKGSVGQCHRRQPRTLSTKRIGTKSQRLTIEYDGKINSTLVQLTHLTSIFKDYDPVLLLRSYILEAFEPTTIHDFPSAQRRYMDICVRYCIVLLTISYQAS